ncbi:MAG: hypothetical protein ACLQAT_10140 [Candidatus Binataceae bacterium]
MAIDEAKLQELLGDKFGLCIALAAAGSLTSAELASHTGTQKAGEDRG